MDVMEALRAHGEAGAQIVDLLYGDAGYEVARQLQDFSKSEVRKLSDNTKRKVTTALSAVGAGAGALGLAVGAKELHTGYREAKSVGTLKPLRAAVFGDKHLGLKPRKLSTALIPVEVAGLGGELSAAHILHNDTKKSNQRYGPTAKSADVDITWTGEISKADDDKRHVFGWASVTSVNGVPVVDLQEDEIDLEEIEKAAYDYVRESRVGGNMHAREGEVAKAVSDLIESFVVTKDKKQILGLPDSSPEGWWCGFAVNDDQTWAQVKRGELTGFSVHGRGRRA